MKMFCKKCGAQLEDNAVFCSACGNRIGNEAPPSQDVGAKSADLAEKGKSDRRKWIGVGVLGVLVIVIGMAAFGVSKGWHIRHEWSEAACTKPETCMKGGETRGEALGHDWEEATCTEPETCTVCGETGEEALGHTAAEATCTEPAVCSVCGAVVEETLEHTWEGGSCLEPQICSVCGTEGEILGHDWNVEYATCDTDKMCDRCQTVEAYALGHELTDDGVCRRCKEQAGILLTASNFQPYFSLSPHTESRYHSGNYMEGYTYWYKMNIKDVNTQVKFHNVKVHVKMYLTADTSREEDGAITGTMHEMTITLDEDGQIIEKSLEPYDMERQMLGKTFDSSDLMFFGRIYEVEGFCYDPGIATIVD